jgi:exopolysaccharide biosynthesis polyprenyl glycosylphosphotransferase
MSQTHLRPQNGWLVLLDLFCLIVSCAVALALRFPNEVTENMVKSHEGWFLFVSSVILANYLGGSYRVQYTFSRFNLVVTWLFSMVFAALLVSLTSFAWFSFILGRGVFAIAALSYGTLSLYVRLVVYQALFRGNYFLRRVVIVGDGDLADYCRKSVENPYVLPRNTVVAYVRCGQSTGGQADGLHDGVPVVECHPDALADVVQGFNVDVVILASSTRDQLREAYPQLRRLHYKGVYVLTGLAVGELYRGRLLCELLDDDEIVRLHMESGLPLIRQFKRFFDVLASLAACLLTLPIWIIVPLVLKISHPRDPVFFVQKRIGQFGQVFDIFKFRTMHPGDGDSEQVWSSPDDPRITRVGYYLRKYRIDEVPQFLNILRGEMSLVGPRPEQPELAYRLDEQIRYYREREMVPPGLTGWAQIQYPYGNTVADARRKLEYDLYYVKNLSVSLDLQVVLRTIRTVLFGKEKREEDRA